MRTLLLLSILVLSTFVGFAKNYEINVGGVEVTSDNASNVTGGAIRGGKVTYDATTNTLTLTDVSISRSGSSDRAIHNRKCEDLTIVMAGTCSFSGSGCSTIYLQKSTSIEVNGTTTITCTSSGDDAIYMNYSGHLDIYGTGTLTLRSTKGEGLEGPGSGTVSVQISNLITECARGSFNKVSNLVFLNFTNDFSYREDRGLRYSSRIILQPTGSSSYAHFNNVNYVKLNSPMSIKMPTGLYTSGLSSSTYYNKRIIISDEETAPGYEAIGNFIYSQRTYSGVKMASLLGPTIEYRATHTNSVEVPGYVTVGGAMRPVYVGTKAFTDLTDIVRLRFLPGVAYIGDFAFGWIPTLSYVHFPGTLTGFGAYLAYKSGGDVGSTTLYWSSIRPDLVAATGTAFADMGSTNKYVSFPTAAAAGYAPSCVSGFTKNTGDYGTWKTTDYNDNNHYFVVTKPSWNGSGGVGETALVACTASAINIGSGILNNEYILYNSSTRYNCTSVAEGAFRNKTSISSVNLSSPNLKTVEANAFYGCTGVSSLTVGSAVTTLGNNAFGAMTGLRTVNWNPATMSDLSSGSTRPFYNTTGVTAFNFGATVKRIPAYLCYNMSSITSLSIPSAVTDVSANAFIGCSGLKQVQWCPEVVTTGYSSSSSPFKGLTGIITFTFPNTVKEIPSYLCNGLTGLISVSLPSQITKIGNGVFYGCTGLRSVYYYCASAAALDYPFPNLSGITTFTFYNGVVDIPSYLCYNLSGITSISLPTSVKTIGTYAFYGTRLNEVTIGTGVTSIGSHAFSSTTLKTVNWNAIACGDFSSTVLPFNNAPLSSVTFGNRVTKIPAYLCYNRNALRSVTIPSGITYIGAGAFRGTGLTSITSEIAAPETLTYGSDIFYGVDKQTCVLSIPGGTLAKYKATSPWSEFFNIVDPEPLSGDVNLDGTVNSGDVSTIYNVMVGVITDEDMVRRADVNGDGSVNSADVSAVYVFLLN